VSLFILVGFKIKKEEALENPITGWALWLTPVNQLLGRQRSGDLRFETSPGKKLVRPPINK
jgi:hypothetical protein